MKLSEIKNPRGPNENGVVPHPYSNPEAERIAKLYVDQLPDDTHTGGTVAEFKEWWTKNVKDNQVGSTLYMRVKSVIYHEYNLPIE